MRKWYNLFRILGYTAGLSGLVLLVVGHRAQPSRPDVQAAGGMLLLAMFCAFLVTYVMYLFALMRRRSGRRPGPAPGEEASRDPE